jgi:hypothetical protein
MGSVMYYGEYQSVTTQQNGCSTSFITDARQQLDMPNQVIRECGPCSRRGLKNGGTHAFRLLKTYTITTNSQIQALKKYADNNFVEFGVSI